MSEQAATDQPARGRQAGLFFVLVTVWIDVLSWGVTIPVYAPLIVEFLDGDVSRAAAISGGFMTLFAAIQLFAAPVLGGLSDRYGRRPVILIACAGLALDLAIMALAQNIWWLLVTRVIHAITAATHTTAGAYIADVTKPEDRAKAFGYMGAAFSFGFIVGPGIGGLLGQIDLRLPFIVGAALAAANVAWGYFMLPESLAKENRAPFRWKQANPFGALNFLRRDRGLVRLAGVHFSVQLAQNIYPALWVLYTSYRYQWDAMMVGLTLAASGVLSMLVQSFMVEPVVKRVGERAALIIGLMFWALAFTVEGWAPTTFWFLIAIPIGALSSFAGPALSSLLSKRVSADQQGQLQGAQGSIISIATLIAPLMYTGVFAYTIADARSVHVPGAAFYIAAAVALVGAALAATALRAPQTEGARG